MCCNNLKSAYNFKNFKDMSIYCNASFIFKVLVPFLSKCVNFENPDLTAASAAIKDGQHQTVNRCQNDFLNQSIDVNGLVLT